MKIIKKIITWQKFKLLCPLCGYSGDIDKLIRHFINYHKN